MATWACFLWSGRAYEGGGGVGSARLLATYEECAAAFGDLSSCRGQVMIHSLCVPLYSVEGS